MRARKFIRLLGGVAAAWSLAAHAQESGTFGPTKATTATLPQIKVARVKSVESTPPTLRLSDEAPAVKRDLHEVGRNRLDEWASGGGLAVGDGYSFRLFDVTVICITAFPCVSFYKETMTAFPRGGRHGNEIKQTGIRSRSNFRCGGIRDDQHIGRRKT